MFLVLLPSYSSSPCFNKGNLFEIAESLLKSGCLNEIEMVEVWFRSAASSKNSAPESVKVFARNLERTCTVMNVESMLGTKN